MDFSSLIQREQIFPFSIILLPSSLYFTSILLLGEELLCCLHEIV